MSTSTDSKRFEEWTCKVDCNECERWWTNQCDGVFQGSEKPCKSFLATRRIVIPARVKSLEKRVKRLETWFIALDVLIILISIAILVGWA
jgi:hypothetical protein